MKLFKPALFFVSLLLQCSPVLADDIITNVMSPIASYQYPDDLKSESLTNGGIVSPIASYQYQDDLSSEALTNGGILSPIASYQYFDWPGNDILNLDSSPVVSYYYQIGNSSGPIILHGHVTDANGIPLSDATVSAMIYSSSMAQANTDVNGNYQMPPLNAGVYDLSAWDATHQTSIRALTLNSNTAEQDFQLNLSSSAPATLQTNRPPPAYTQLPIGPLGSTLKIFDGNVFTNITAANAPQTNLMTIVLTHGWIMEVEIPIINYNYVASGGVEGWPTDMARTIRAQGVTANMANILAWDWRYGAEGPYPLEENTPAQGVALGTNLQQVLGATYSQPIHFIGHSLGTMVNAAAANYLHGEGTAQQAVSPTPWTNVPMHMTLFDQAEISIVGDSTEFLFDGLTTLLAAVGRPLQVATDTSYAWKPSMPIHSTWGDNYISLVGFYQANAVNIALQKGEGVAFLQAASESQGLIPLAINFFEDAHSYPMIWYSNSIVNPNDSILGFQQSYEYNQLVGLSLFPPSTADFSLGDSYHQVPSASDPLALEPLPGVDVDQTIVPLLGNGASVVVQGAVGGANAVMQISGNAVVGIENGAQATANMATQGFNYVLNAATQGAQSVQNLVSSDSLQLLLTTGPAIAFSSLAQMNSVHSLDSPSGNSNIASNTPAMAWIPMLFPANATAMAFDFTVSGNPVDDALVCGIGESNLFSIQAEYIPTNTISTSRLIDVSQWAGTTNELFFGFMGGTSTNATLQIQNIRFFSLQSPQLAITPTGNGILLAWPNTAGGYAVETTTNLATSDWETVTNVQAISGNNYVITNSWPDQIRFFRLQQQQ
jgi:hypothetical protein